MFDKAKLQGVFAPIVTPFDKNEIINYHDIAFNIELYNESDLRGYMPLGSNGEFQGLTDDESVKVLETVCKHRSKDKVIVGGCGRESVHKTVEFIKKVAYCGLDLAFILPPHYFRNYMTDEALFEYYVKVANASPIPIVVYNAPKFAAGLNLCPMLIKSLAEHTNIVAMKNSSDTPNIEYINVIPNLNFSIVAGNIKSFYQGLIDGAIGGVLSTASVFPEYCCKLYDYFVSGDIDSAEKLHSYLHNVSINTVGPLSVAGVKAGMAIRGFKSGHVRLPLLDVDDMERERLVAFFKQSGIDKYRV